MQALTLNELPAFANSQTLAVILNMPLKVTLRNNLATSKFKHLLLGLINSPIGNDLVLGTGYVWEDITGKSYQISKDLLGAALAKSITGNLTTIAGKIAYRYNYKHYVNFVTSLRTTYGMTVTAKVAPQKNWHAKIAIKLNQGKPIAALIGSSNLTAPAFAEPPQTSRWNFECDVLIWLDNPQLNTHFNSLLDAVLETTGTISAVLDETILQPSEQVQLDSIYADVTNGLDSFENI